MRQKNNPYAGVTGVAPGTTDLVNTSTGYYSGGWGSLPDSSIGASQEGDTGVLENSGFTAMIIRNNGEPEYASRARPRPGSEQRRSGYGRIGRQPVEIEMGPFLTRSASIPNSAKPSTAGFTAISTSVRRQRPTLSPAPLT